MLSFFNIKDLVSITKLLHGVRWVNNSLLDLVVEFLLQFNEKMHVN